MNINEMAAAAHAQSAKSGFWEDYKAIQAILPFESLCESYDRSVIGEKIGLIHTEVSEALEEVRDGHAPDETYYRADGKPEGLPAELADVLIRVGDLAGAFNIDLEAAVVEKMAFNATREHRHGKKF